jgi:tripartite-type tricarboxylate transporter receptor subunit TctC
MCLSIAADRVAVFRFALSRLALIGVGALFAIATPAGAQGVAAFPAAPVRVLVPNTPGSSADLMARYVAARLADTWRQPVNVENRAGAGGIFAADAVAKAAPDGHTLLLGADGPITILPSLAGGSGVAGGLPYNPQRDLVPVASLGQTDFVLVANPKLGLHTLQDFIAAARRSPGRLNYASAGIGSPQQFSMEMLKQTAGVYVTHIPYRGGPLGMSDVVAGQVDVMFIAVGPALPHIQSGRLVALATGGEVRHPLLPGVPTVAETYKGFRAGTWFGLFAPTGTPAAAVDAIGTEVHRILSAPSAHSDLAAQGIRATGYPAAQFGSLVRVESEKFAALVKSVGLKAE